MFEISRMKLALYPIMIHSYNPIIYMNQDVFVSIDK